jgi:hypothetical protein
LGGSGGLESAAAARAAIASAQEELESVSSSALGALVGELGMNVCESKLLGKFDDTGRSIATCGGKVKGIESILRFGGVRKKL